MMLKVTHIRYHTVVDTHVHTSKLGPGKLKHLLHLLLLPHVTPPSNQFTTFRGQLLRQRLNERESTEEMGGANQLEFLPRSWLCSWSIRSLLVRS